MLIQLASTVFLTLGLCLQVPVVTKAQDLCQPIADCVAKLDAGDPLDSCDPLPVPERAKLDILPTGTSYKLTSLRNNVWMFNDGGYTSLIIVTGRRLTMIDLPETASALLMPAAEEVLNGVNPRRIDMIYSHGHYDHIGAGTAFYESARAKWPNAKVMAYGTKQARRMIRTSKSKKAPIPHVLIKDGDVLKLKRGLEIQMHIVTGHTREDVLVYIPKYKKQASVAMLVDIVYPRWSPWPLLGLTEDIQGYIDIHHELLEFDFVHYVGGHLLLGSREDVEESLRFVEDLFLAGGVGVATSTFPEFMENGYGKIFDPSLPESGNVWYAFVDVVRRTQVSKCYRIMLENWGCQIGGLDQTLASHCFLAVSYALLQA